MIADHRELLSLRGLPRGPGRAVAPAVYAALWSHARWPRGKGRGKFGESWAAVETLALECGSDVRTVRRALALLRDGGFITSRWSNRGGVVVHVATLAASSSAKLRATLTTSTPVIRLPRAGEVAALKGLIGRIGHSTPGDRSSALVLRPGRALKTQPGESPKRKPGPAFSLALALYAARSIETRGEHDPDQPHEVTTSLAALQDMTGGGSRAHFRRRLDVLETAGVITRSGAHWGDGITLLPVLTALVDAAPQRPRLSRQPMRSCAPATPAATVEPRGVADWASADDWHDSGAWAEVVDFGVEGASNDAPPFEGWEVG